MKRFHKYSLPVAAATMLAAVLTLAAPGAVHAVTAALVNVTNTAASPAIGQSVSQLASQNVFLVGLAAPNTFATVARMSPDGTVAATGFVVPSGQFLVVTSIEISPSLLGGAAYLFEIMNGVSGALRVHMQAPGLSTTQFQFPSGIIFPAGESVTFLNESGSPANMTLYMHGYLTSN